jgi:hypothetical protein
VAREAEQVPTVVHELMDGVSLYQGSGPLLGANEVKRHEREKSDKDDPGEQFACGQWHCRGRMRDDLRHGEAPKKMVTPSS